MKAKIVLLMFMTTLLVGCGPDVLPEADVSTTGTNGSLRTDGVNDLPCMVTTRAGVLDAIVKFENACGISEYRDCAPISKGVYQCSNYKIDGVYVPPPNPAAIPKPNVIVEPFRSLQAPEVIRGAVSVTPAAEVKTEAEVEEIEEVEPQSAVSVPPVQPPMANVSEVVVPVAQPEVKVEIVSSPVILDRDSLCESEGFDRTLARKVFTPHCNTSGFAGLSCNIDTHAWECTDILPEPEPVPTVVPEPAPVVRAPVVKTTPIKEVPTIIKKPTTAHYDLSNIPKPDLDIVVDFDDFTDGKIIDESNRWVAVIKSGGNVWVSGFSSGIADVLEYIAFAYPDINLKKVAVVANYSMDDISTIPYAIVSNYAVALRVESNDEIDVVIATNMNSKSPKILELYPTGP